MASESATKTPMTPDKLTLLGELDEQEVTSSPRGVFDVSQFKQHVNKDNISPEVIEELQQEFKNDMVGAIDRFHNMEKESGSTAMAPTATERREEKTWMGKDAETKDIDEDLLGRKEFVIRDRYWDRDRRAYVLQKPTETKKSTRNERYVILARKDYNEDMKTFDTVIVVYGKILRNALRNIFQGAMNFSLTDSENTELQDHKFMYWAKPELELLFEHYNSVGDKTAAFEIRAALNLIEWAYGDMKSVLASLLPKSITFDHLWALIPPGSLVVGQDDLDFTDIWRALFCKVDKTLQGVFLFITAECIVWNGEKMGYSSKTLTIPEFSGLKTIDDLPYIPLKYHSKREAILQKVRKRSAKAIKFWTPGFQLQENEGVGLAEIGGGIQRYAFSGRSIIDPSMMRSTHPGSNIMPSSRSMRDISRKGRAWISDLISKEEYPCVLEVLLKDANQTVHEGVQNGGPAYIATPRLAIVAAKPQTGDVTLSDEQMLLVSSLLYRYSLQDGMWGAFSADRVADVVWNTKIFPSLVIEPSLKSVICQLVTAHSSDIIEFDDFVKGKGRGLIGLLFGPPGSGKTLTAEAVAETTNLPLYMVSSGALGHDPEDIEENLSTILKLASHWKAVLLLDEADVFLAERTETDIERNAVVSIFLRELEYYQGILLLTTNQAQVIDPAFQSRIHFSLHYPELDTAAHEAIWTNFINRVREVEGVDVDVTSEDTHALAEMPLNGRQIKNAVSIAVKIASNSTERKITSGAIISTAKLLQNQEYQEKPLGAARDEHTLEPDCFKSEPSSAQNVDMLPERAMSRSIGTAIWHYMTVGMTAEMFAGTAVIAALFALAYVGGIGYAVFCLYCLSICYLLSCLTLPPVAYIK